MNIMLLLNQFKNFSLTAGKKLIEIAFIILLKLHISCFKKTNLKNINKIAIPLFAGIGDAIILTTFLQNLKTIFPQAQVWIFELPRTKNILRDTYPEFQFRTIDNIQSLKKFKGEFNLFIAPSRKMSHYMAALFLKPAYFIGYNYSLKIRKKESHVLRYNRLAAHLGLEQLGRPALALAKHAIEKAHLQLQPVFDQNPTIIIGLIVGGRWPSKTYPQLYFNELVEKLSGKYKSAVFILLGSDFDAGENIAKIHQRAYNYAGQYSIQETMGFIAHTDIIIGPDGGLLNVAMGMHKQIIGLFGSVDPQMIVPENYLQDILFIKQCPFQPCYNENHEPLCRMDRPYCIEIPVATIFNKFEEICDRSFLHQRSSN